MSAGPGQEQQGGPATGNLAGRLGALSGAKVVVVGDIMLDRFVTGSVERISPEAPIPIFKVGRESEMLGGAGNVLRNLIALGVEARLLAVVGDDSAGATVRHLVADAGADSAGILTEPHRGTTIKERYLASGQQILRADRECRPELRAETQVELLGNADEALAGSGALILSDYGKGVLDRETIDTLIARARGLGVPVVVDPKGRDYAIYQGARIVTPNRRELAEAAGRATDSLEKVGEAARAVIFSCGIDAVLATLSAEGMMLVEGSHPPQHFNADVREVYDVSGAGDTVVAGLSAGLAAGFPMEEAIRLANAAAGVVVGKRGTAVATTGEVVRALYASRLHAAEEKLMDLETAAARVTAWRQAGFRIGFTNGVFDLLHPGHVSLLRQARGLCDRLVVGLNSDASVRRLKGEDRPVQDEAARAAVLASLASVDLVAVFAEDTPLALIEALRPDVLVKGADYTRDTVVGADLVESYGGEVRLADLTPGHSTSETIRKLKS